MVTILGQHISLIRPSLGHQNKVYKNERPQSKYNQRPKTNHHHTGKVIAICIEVKGKVFSLAKGIHIDVLNHFNINPLDVEKTGWKLENGNYLWR